MAHSYRKLQQWNQWIAEQFLGISVMIAERQLLSSMLAKHLGKHALLIGVPHQSSLLKTTILPSHTIISPWSERGDNIRCIEANLDELPIFTGVIDLVILPHTLEFAENPRRILSEACRVIKPEGLIAICGFNPHSAWGIKKRLTTHRSIPWNGNFMEMNKIKGWLRLVDFQLEQQQLFLFRPPLQKQALYENFVFFEKIGQHFFPFIGGAYILIARAKVIPLTPIKLQWKQGISGIKILPTVPTHSLLN